MYKFYAVGAQKLNKNPSIQPEMDARIIKQPDVIRNGPQRLSGTALPLPITDVLNWKCCFISFLFLGSNKKNVMWDVLNRCGSA